MAAAPLKPPGEEDDLDENMQVNINPRIRIQLGLGFSLAAWPVDLGLVLS